MIDHDDDLLRDALRAEAEGITADADLLSRIQAAAQRSPRRRLAPWLLVAAACALSAGLAATVLTDDDQVVDAVNHPSSTTSISPSDVRDQLSTLFPCGDGVVLQTALYLAPDAGTAAVETMRTALESEPRVLSTTFVDQAAVGAALEQDAPGSAIRLDTVPSAFIVTFATEEESLQVRGVVSDLPGVYASVSTACEPIRP